MKEQSKIHEQYETDVAVAPLFKQSIRCDSYDFHVYEQMKDLGRLVIQEEKCVSRLPTTLPLVIDCFNAFYKNVPELYDEVEMRSAYLLNRKIMQEILGCSRYDKLRCNTKLSQLESAIATESMIDFLLDNIESVLSEKLIKKMSALDQREHELLMFKENLSDIENLINQESIDDYKSLIQKLNEERKELKQDIDQIEIDLEDKLYVYTSSSYNQDKSHSPLELSKKHLDYLKVEVLNEREEIKQEVDQLKIDLKEKLHLIRSLTHKALHKVDEGLENLSELFNLIPGNHGYKQTQGKETLSDLKAKLKLACKLRNKNNLLTLAKLVGKYKRIAVNKQKIRDKSLPIEIFDVIRGDNFNKILQSELIDLSQDTLRYNFYF